MPQFRYLGRDDRGQKSQGEMQGQDAQSVARDLLAQRITPLTIDLVRGPSLTERLQAWLVALREPRVTAQDLQLFSRQIHTLLKSGVPILRALEGLRQSAVNPAMGRVVQEVASGLQSGRDLSSCLARHPRVFSHFYCSMVQVGELTGRLDEVFLNLAEHLEFEREMVERVSSALRYPSFVVAAIAGAMVIINLLVIPAFAKVFASFHAQLPWLTRVLIATSQGMVQYGGLLLLALVLLGLSLRHALNQPAGRLLWDRLKLRLPLAGPIATKAVLARFCASFAMSMRSGVPIASGLASVALAVDNAHLRTLVERMRDGIERGDSVHRNAVAAGVFTPVILQMIAVGEETGCLDDMMDEVAQLYRGEVDFQLKRLSAQIEPILIVVLGALVMVLALGVFLPMWDLGAAARGGAG
ncbi:type II secretion system F family protein [Curvibacter sp. HBC61]|uniref:Type II secretion system F family protein n=1 Tax=Curvibacter cyanobacteriorum TaxID=3026422 RepID=A0ABT5N358_9BURK|nr:type II secretion system F family protein [Curvibacter sp. HBC61]MDD0840753.1 type II secretion system F family protein [Curvibacter sp. HBC61]